MGPNTIFKRLLERAETRFGPRSHDLKIKVNGRDDEIPQTERNGEDGCIVYYYGKVRRDDDRLQFQLAHEAIHVLSGAIRREALLLEEGLATRFSLDVSSLSYRDSARASLPVLFKDALVQFEQLRATDQTIKALRLKCPCLDDVTPDLLKEFFSATDELANSLCARVPPDMHLRLA